MPWPKGKKWPLFRVVGSVEVRVEVNAEMIVKARDEEEAEHRAFDISRRNSRRVILDENAVMEAVFLAPFFPEDSEEV